MKARVARAARRGAQGPRPGRPRRARRDLRRPDRAGRGDRRAQPRSRPRPRARRRRGRGWPRCCRPRRSAPPSPRISQMRTSRGSRCAPGGHKRSSNGTSPWYASAARPVNSGPGPPSQGVMMLRRCRRCLDDPRGHPVAGRRRGRQPRAGQQGTRREGRPRHRRGQAGQRDDLDPARSRRPPPGSKEEKELAAKVTTSVRGFLDIDQLGKRAMADQWGKLTQAAAGPVPDAAARADRGQLRARPAREPLVHRSTTPARRPTRTATSIVDDEDQHPAQGPPVHDRGRLRARQGGRQAHARGTSRPTASAWSRTTARMFNKIIAKDGFDGLIAKMKKKQARPS